MHQCKRKGNTMVKVRPVNKEKYGISKERFWELYYYCLQYEEYKVDDGLKERRKMIEKTAVEVGKELQSQILKAVTIGTGYSEVIKAIGPCDKKKFYEKRRVFYQLLDRNIEKQQYKKIEKALVERIV